MSLKELAKIALDYDTLKQKLPQTIEDALGERIKTTLLEGASISETKKIHKCWTGFQNKAIELGEKELSKEQLVDQLNGLSADEQESLVRLSALIFPIVPKTESIAELIAKSRLEGVKRVREGVFGKIDRQEETGVIVHRASGTNESVVLTDEQREENNKKEEDRRRKIADLGRILAGELLNEPARAVKTAVQLREKTSGVRMYEGQLQSIKGTEDDLDHMQDLMRIGENGELLPPPKRGRGRPKTRKNSK